MTHLNNPRNAKMVLLLVALGALTVFGSGSSRADEPVSSTRPLVATPGVIQACCLNDECQILVVLLCIQLGGIPTGAASWGTILDRHFVPAGFHACVGKASGSAANRRNRIGIKSGSELE